MAKRKWYDNEFLNKWGWVLLVGCWAVLAGPDVVESVINDPSAWDIAKALAWLLAIVAVATSNVRRRPLPERIDPATVPSDDVAGAIADTPSRVGAVKLLRERNPGLGLKDAADLVDASDTEREGR
ncbi:MAG: hypothetical protein WBD41_15955 [Rhodococcus sp. (in: high G+C Gram-positive bacteria)]|jgi:hypothetical protein